MQYMHELVTKVEGYFCSAPQPENQNWSRYFPRNNAEVSEGFYKHKITNTNLQIETLQQDLSYFYIIIFINLKDVEFLFVN